MNESINLSEIVAASLNKLQSDGKINEMIEKHLTEALDNIVRSVFSYNTDLRKSLESEIKKKMQIDISEVTIPEYNKSMVAIIEKQLSGVLHVQGIAKFEEDVKQMLSQEAPETIKISELMKQFAMDDSGADERSNEISFHHDSHSDGYHWFHFDKKSNKQKYECGYTVAITGKGKIFSGKFGNKEFNKTVFLGGLYGFDAKLYKMYAAGTVIEPDFGEVETEYYYDDE